MCIPTQFQECSSSQGDVKHGHMSLSRLYSSFWFLLSIHLQRCRYSASHTQKKTEHAWKNELKPAFTSQNIDQTHSKPSNANSKWSVNFSGCLKMSCFPGEPCQHKEAARMSFHIHPRPNFAMLKVETISTPFRMLWNAMAIPGVGTWHGLQLQANLAAPLVGRIGNFGWKKNIANGPSQLDESSHGHAFFRKKKHEQQ